MKELREDLIEPVIFLPGITASSLTDKYKFSYATMWDAQIHTLGPEIYGSKYNAIEMHPAHKFNYEIEEPSLIEPKQVFKVVYEEFISDLRADLAKNNRRILKNKQEQKDSKKPKNKQEREDNNKPKNQPLKKAPVYPFPYDWRQPLDKVEQQLDKFIEEVIHRTRLIPEYSKSQGNWDGKVCLIGHSMGGYIATSYATEAQGINHSHYKKVGKLITIGAPFKGSTQMPYTMTKEGRKGKYARTIPSMYYLVPEQLFDINQWQISVTESWKEYWEDLKELSSLDDVNQAQNGEELMSQILRGAEKYRENVTNQLEKIYSGEGKFDKTNFLLIFGRDVDTLDKFYTDKEKIFIFGKKDKDDKKDENEKDGIGDGTVTTKSSCGEYLSKRVLSVSFSKKDYDVFFDFGDILFVLFAGKGEKKLHINMHNLEKVKNRIEYFLSAKDANVQINKYENDMGQLEN